MGYRHFDINYVQSPKNGGLCGDVCAAYRDGEGTLFVLADGLGSGVKAHLAASMTASRLLRLLESDYSLREAFDAVVRTMNDAREPGLPYAAFALARLKPNGSATILSYEMPTPVLLSRRSASPLRQRTIDRDGACLAEAAVDLDDGDSLLFVSDGVTQAGLGNGMAHGWGVGGLCRWLRTQPHDGQLPERIRTQARKLWGEAGGDDCTAAVVTCRAGSVVSLWTGPPASKQHDGPLAAQFLQLPGAKVICGATTAKIAARQCGAELKVSETSLNGLAPPHYELQGVDLVTEGAVTLNQVYNLFEEDAEELDSDSGVTKLCGLLRGADRINIIVGRARNVAEDDISFRQQGIMPRSEIVPLLKNRLEKNQKLVVIEEI